MKPHTSAARVTSPRPIRRQYHEDGQRHPQAARPVVAARRRHPQAQAQDQDEESGPPADGHGEDQPGGAVEPAADRTGRAARRRGPAVAASQSVSYQISSIASLPEPGLDGRSLQPPEEKDDAHGKVQGRQEGPIRHGRQCGPRAAQGGPEEADHEQAGEPVEHARRVARMRIGDHLHIGDAAAERPAERAEHGEVGGPAMPVVPSGQEDRRQGRQRPGIIAPYSWPKFPRIPHPSDSESAVAT